MFAFFLATLVIRSVDRLALVHYASPHALGLYSLGLIVASTLLHVPESVAYVLLPRLASAAAGGRDPDRTREEAIRVQRAIAVGLPLLAAAGVVLVEPVIAWVLPDYLPGVPALRVLAFGAVLMAAGTVPAYALLAERNAALRLELGWGGALGQGILVFAWASRDPRPESVAMAASLGFGLFSAVLVSQVASRWSADPSRRRAIMVSSFAPALIVCPAMLIACSLGNGASWGVTLLRLIAVAVVAAPVTWAFGRGLGLGEARVWIRRAAPRA
jgi:O-antigen/teichoic acid export membrane protein